MRLFPKKRGAHRFNVSGIARRCDYVILSSSVEPHTYLHCNAYTRNPRHIFLSLRNPVPALRFFAERLLPSLELPFVLVSGSEDITIPHQTDYRFTSFESKELSMIDNILRSDKLLHWFCENLDDGGHPLMSPLPTGMVFRDSSRVPTVPVPEVTPLWNRQTRVLCAHRIREGPQWQKRRDVTSLAKSDWSEWCTVVKEEVPKKEFLELIRSHAFVLCVEGGGLDPSPKAWETILNGAIPIVRSSPSSAAYGVLPVAFVSSWSKKSLTYDKIKEWHSYFSKEYNQKFFRSKIIHKLSIDYWWNKILLKSRDKGDCDSEISVLIDQMNRFFSANFEFIISSAKRRLSSVLGN